MAAQYPQQKKGSVLSGASVRTVKHDENGSISKSLNQINVQTKHSKWWPQHTTPMDPLFPRSETVLGVVKGWGVRHTWGIGGSKIRNSAVFRVIQRRGDAVD